MNQETAIAIVRLAELAGHGAQCSGIVFVIAKMNKILFPSLFVDFFVYYYTLARPHIFFFLPYPGANERDHYSALLAGYLVGFSRVKQLH